MKNDQVLMTLLFAIILFVSFSEAEGTVLKEIYQRDYELINRTVLVFSSKPDFVIEESRDNQQIIVYLRGAKKDAHVAPNQSFVSPVLKTVRITEEPDRLIVTVNTQKHAYLNHFTLHDPEHKLVLDIYNKKSPQTEQDKFYFAKFYYAASFFKRAENLFLELAGTSPEKTGVNYYLGKILLRRDAKKAAADKFSQVNYLADEYLKAQAELLAMGYDDTVFRDESEEAFAIYRDNFLRAGELNRQMLLVALSETVYGDEQKIRQILTDLDYTDPILIEMLTNFQRVRQHILQDNELRKALPAHLRIARHTSPLPWYLLIIVTAVITALLVIFIYNKVSSDKTRIKAMSEPVPQDSPARSKQPEEEEVVEKISQKQDYIPEKEEELPARDSEPDISAADKELEDKDQTESEEKEPDLKPAKMESENLKARLIMQLHNTGWNIEAIAGELEMDESEVKAIIENKTE